MGRMRTMRRTSAMLSLAGMAGAAGAQPCEWMEVGGGMNVEVYALTVFDGALHAGGAFLSAGGVPALRIARWDGPVGGWSGLGSGVVGPYNSPDVLALAVYDDGQGAGPALYAGGTFTEAGGIEALYIAKWDGAAWSRVGAGMNSRVWALSVFDGSLYAGGSFSYIGGILTPSRVARWDGSAWHAVGLSSTEDHVRALAVFDGGLYAGRWRPNGTSPAMPVGRWDGAEWIEVGSAGMSPAGPVFALHEFGGSLYAGGAFGTAGGSAANGIARWDGAMWSDVGGGVGGSHLASIRAMASFDDGGGLALHVGGLFSEAGGAPASGIAKWDGAAWMPLGTGAGPSFNPSVYALAALDPGDGPSLVAGGSFEFMGGIPAARIARWRCEAGVQPCYANCDASTSIPILNVDDFTCFINEFAAAQVLPHEQQVEHYANCDASTTAPVLNVDDFTCFMNAFASGCP